MNKFLNDIWAEYEDELNIIYGYSDYDLIIRPEGTTDSQFIYCRYQECTIGNLLADAYKASGNAEISIVNGGTIRNSLNKGNLTRGQIISAAPFFNDIVVKRLPGQCILDALEHGVSNLPNSAGGFPQVSGLSYDVDTSFNSTVLKDSQGLFLNITGKRRVSNVKVNGEDLDVNRIYNVSMNSFIGRGGDGYSMFSNYEVFSESLMTDTDSLAYYIKNDLNGKIPAEYSNFQGRINIYNGSAVDNTIVTTTVQTVQENSSDFFGNNYRKKSSGGLSAGGIIAIILPLVIALIAITVIALMCSNKNLPIQSMTNDSGNRIINKINYP